MVANEASWANSKLQRESADFWCNCWFRVKTIPFAPMKGLPHILRMLTLIGALCLPTRAALAVYNAPDPLAPLADPRVVQMVDGSHRISATASSPQVIEPLPTPEPAAQYAAVAIPTPVAAPCEQCPAPTHAWFKESTIYTRIDYFHWNERLGNADFVNEDGAFWTLGYERRFDRERFRVELFDSTLNYRADVVDNIGNVEPLDSITNYLGMRAELEVLFEPELTPNATFFIGMGTRFWVRDLPDDFTDSGLFVPGYQETWWTFYPYIGLERRRKLTSAWEFFGMGRIGFTAITLERISDFDIVLYPEPGVTGQLEAGLRGRHLFVSAFSEAMSWRQSPPSRGALQPSSSFASIGLRTGCSF